ncbi:MAG TPA: DUF1385 domain-containing protein [Microthrixaceae bacterium]|nr:DUF1385 domain-containing protein [Microthrixaceae bacterium]
MGHELVGGQALVEGVMIRQGPRWAAAARRPDGSIATTTRHAAPAFAATRGIPVVRGIGALVDSVRIGLAAMRWSREETTDPTSADAAPVGGARERVVVLGVVAGVLAAFLLVPLAIAALARPVVGTGWGAAVVEGLVRLALFVAYLAMLSTLPGVRRTLEYHGAEHMVIAAHEHGEDRTIDSAWDYSVRHPRCGTDFFLLIFVISIVAFALVGHLPAAALVLSRILLAPVVVGVAYEILRLGGTSEHDGLAAALSAPGLFLQRFTTRQPDDAQIAVALAALDELLPPSASIGTTSRSNRTTSPL